MKITMTDPASIAAVWTLYAVRSAEHRRRIEEKKVKIDPHEPSFPAGALPSFAEQLAACAAEVAYIQGLIGSGASEIATFNKREFRVFMMSGPNGMVFSIEEQGED